MKQNAKSKSILFTQNGQIWHRSKSMQLFEFFGLQSLEAALFLELTEIVFVESAHQHAITSD